MTHKLYRIRHLMKAIKSLAIKLKNQKGGCMVAKFKGIKLSPRLWSYQTSIKLSRINLSELLQEVTENLEKILILWIIQALKLQLKWRACKISGNLTIFGI